MSDKELIKAMVDFHGIPYQEIDGVIKIQPCNGVLRGFTQTYNPLSNGTQREEFYEKAEIGIRHLVASDTWSARVFLGKASIDKSRTKAGLLCAANLLGVEWS